MNNNLDIKEKQELEMNTINSDKNWELSYIQGHKLTNTAIWNEYEWKVNKRFFRTARHIKIQRHLGSVLKGR